MSTTVDNRVLEMRFDNKQFESSVATSMSTLDKLKQKLNLSGAAKGLDDVGKAAKKCDLSGMRSGLESVSAKFSALQVMGVTALANITNSAVNAGKRIASALTIEPIKMGFQEYETQINAIQTILANTQHEGTNLKQVNSALDELNTYADKTIYNFTEMTRNIGTFTAAGVNLRTSVDSIKGIANLAAISGSSANQASTAMYQLSQALAAGRVSLMDWNSVVNAGMGGKVFQDALIRTSELLGTGAKGAIDMYGSFRESLTQGQWLTTEVLTETLKQFAGAYSEADLVAQGFSKSQAKEIAQMAKTAEDAATKVKTFTQLWDTLKEAAQSGWTQSWEIIIGDFEEARAALTEVSNVVGEMLAETANARNSMLQGWKDLGGRTALIDSIKNAFAGVMSVVKPVKEAFRDVFPPMTSERLLEITEGLKELTANFKMGAEEADKVKRIFKGLFSVLGLASKMIGAVGKAVYELGKSEGFQAFLNVLLDAGAAIGDVFTAMDKGFESSGISGALIALASGISEVLGGLSEGIGGIGKVFSSIAKGIAGAAGEILGAIKPVFEWISENVTGIDIFAGLTGGGIFMVASKLSGSLSKITDSIDKFIDTFKGNGLKGIKENICGILDAVHDSLMSFTTGIKITSLLTISISIGILASALETLSKIKGESIAKSLVAIGVMLIMLTGTFKKLTKVLDSLKPKKMVSAGIFLMSIAKAVKMLSDAVSKLAKLSWNGIIKGLTGIGVSLLALSGVMKLIGGAKIPLTTSVAILAIAKSCEMIADALLTVSGMSWNEVKRGLVAMGGALAELVAAVSILGKTGKIRNLIGSAGILIITQSLSEIADALTIFGSMSWEEIKRGLSGMGGALGELTIVIGILGRVAGFSSLFASGSILITTQSLSDIAEALQQFSVMTWDEIKRGLVGMGGALAEVAGISGALGRIAGLSGLLGSGSILITVQALPKLADAFGGFASLDWDSIKQGLVGMGGALTEVAGVSGALGMLAGLSAIFGSGSILITVQALPKLADAFSSFAGLDWDSIKRGLVGMGGALAEVAGVSGALGALTGLSGILGGGAILVGVQGLGELAGALQQFGSMTWDEIKRGLVGMGGALTEVSVVSGILGTLTGLSGIIGGGAIAIGIRGLGDLATSLQQFGGMTWDDIKRGLVGMGGALAEVAGISGILGTIAGPLVLLGGGALLLSVQGLGDLASALQQFASMNWDEIKRGLAAMGGALSEVSSGVRKFIFSGFGADAVATVAEPLGVLASSIKKWSGVTVPEGIGEQMEKLADGIGEFMFSGMSAGVMATVADPLGKIASAVKKWAGVTVPENIGTQLESLADGVKAFTWAFMGGFSMDAVIGPLGKLPGSIKKWNGVAVPEGIEGQLKDLAAGVKAFSWAFMAGWSLDTITGPLGQLATSVKKWNGVSVPSNLTTQLKNLAAGAKSFTDVGDISRAINSLKVLASSASKLSGVDYGSISSGVTTLVNAFKKLSNVDTSGLSKLKDASSSLSKVAGSMKKSTSGFSKVGSDMVSSISKGFTSRESSLTSSAKSVASAMVKAFTGQKSEFQRAGSELMTRLIAGIRSQTSKIKTTISSAVRTAANAIRTQKGSFQSAGSYLGSGLISGINSKKSAAYSAGFALGKAAVKGEKDGQKSKSPSKLTIQAGEWLGEGLIIGMQRMGIRVYKSGRELGSSAVNSMSNAISKVSDFVSTGMNTQPTIRPVLDMGGVQTGVNAINDMFGKSMSVGMSGNVSAIRSMMSRRNQNGTNSDVVSAIDSLRKDIANIGGTTYNSINGITYDDGSNISEAIKTIVRAATIERRV